jgi:hypothetical protein
MKAVPLTLRSPVTFKQTMGRPGNLDRPSPVKDHLMSGTLARVFSQHETTVTHLDIDIYAIYPCWRNKSATIRLFIDYLSTEFSKHDWP